MLTVQELFHAVRWEEVEAVLLERYGDEAGDLSGLREAFHFIRNCELEPNPEGWVIEIDSWFDEEEGKVVWDVHARKPGDEQVYGMGLSLLDEWAGHFVSEKALAAFSPAEAAAHILWEAIWWGCSNEAILARRRELEEMVEELERNPDVGVPTEEVFRELGVE
ncbi:DUF6557 family protein [Desulfovirgula thermocuniculi]|uniref:DUF6557 family protein n=1 Tax=Desulfovirgula thermocuniculi TaxID=348842 RepID=UPI0004205A80|nr:DUF6557 family protein [Desulfovirgula thermocuniculi]